MQTGGHSLCAITHRSALWLAKRAFVGLIRAKFIFMNGKYVSLKVVTKCHTENMKGYLHTARTKIIF
jgi:hypothetical protein